MPKPVENLTGADATAFQQALTPFVSAIVDNEDIPAIMAAQTELNERGLALAQQLWGPIRANQEDVNILIITDSTGDATNEPWYRWADEVVAPAAPTHTAVYNQWSDGSQAYSSTTLQAGSGGQTITFDAMALAGSGLGYSQGGREAAIYAAGRNYDLVIVAQGHNLGYLLTGTQLYGLLLSSMLNLTERHPKAAIFVTAQNPWLRYLDYSRSTHAAWRRVANALGLGLIDIASRFEALPDFATQGIEGGTIDTAYYNQDGQGGLHPNAAGSELGLQAIRAALAETPFTGIASIQRPMARAAVCLSRNPAFTQWTGAAPDGYTLSNVTVAKTPRARRGLYSMAVTPTSGTNPQITFDLSDQLATLRGTYLMLLMEVWVPSTMDSTAGRIQILTTGASNRNETSYPFIGVGGDGWRYAVVIHPILQTDVSITGAVLCGKADGSDSGKTLFINKIIPIKGLMPGDLSALEMSGGTMGQYYNPVETGVPSGSTGTLALSGTELNTHTVTDGTAGSTRSFSNIKTVPGREYLVSIGTRSFIGAAGLNLLVRGPSGTGTVIATAAAILNNATLRFTATGTLHSVVIAGNTDVTGFVVNGLSVVELYSGIVSPIRQPLNLVRNTDWTLVDATGAAGKFKLVSTVGTSLVLQGQAAQNNTQTERGLIEVALPQTYIAGRNFSVIVNAQRTGSGTAGTNTVDVEAFRIADAGTQGSDVCASAAQTLTGSAADYTFQITGASFAPGERVLLRLTTAIQETANASTLTAQINSIRIA